MAKTLGGVRVDGDDHKRWKLAAAADGLTLAEWVRRRLNGAKRRDPRLDPRAGDVMRDATGEALADLMGGPRGCWVMWTVTAVTANGLVWLRWVDERGNGGGNQTTRRILGAGWTTLEAVYVVPDGARSSPSMG